MQESLNTKDRPWLDIVETVSVVGSIASIFINQAALASIPLSITVMLNVVNRRMQLEAAAKHNLSAVSQIMPALETNNQQLSHLSQLKATLRNIPSNSRTPCGTRKPKPKANLTRLAYS